MQFRWMRLILALVVFAPGATVAANNLSRTASLIGTWKCATARDHTQLHVTFRADGTVVGHTKEKHLAGKYVQEGDSLSIVGDDQVIAASSLRLDQKVAAANLLNGDQISCRRLK